MDQHEEIRSAVAELEIEFPKNTFLVFAMGLKLQSMDYAALFRDEVLDGPDDKKIDFFFIDREAGTALIAQDFQSPNWDKAAPPTNKATDLNAAISWIFDAELDDIPTPALRAKALELRDAITEGIFTALK